MGADAPPIRVSVHGASGVLGDVVSRAVRDAPGLELVAPDATPSAADPMPAQVVILAGVDPDTITWPTAELGCAATRLLAISDDGQRSCLFELLPHREALGELTADSLLAAVRRPLPRFVATRTTRAVSTPSVSRDRSPRLSPLIPRRPNGHQED